MYRWFGQVTSGDLALTGSKSDGPVQPIDMGGLLLTEKSERDVADCSTVTVDRCSQENANTTSDNLCYKVAHQPCCTGMEWESVNVPESDGK